MKEKFIEKYHSFLLENRWQDIRSTFLSSFILLWKIIDAAILLSRLVSISILTDSEIKAFFRNFSDRLY